MNAVEQSDKVVAAYNAKDFEALTSLLHADLDFSHVNRGFSYRKRDDLMEVLDIPGFAKAGEQVAITICSVLRFDAQGRLVEWKDYG